MRGFTLVEMMVAVCVLAIGITLVSRSFISTISVMDTMQNRIAAVYYLSSRMNALEEKSLEKKTIEMGESREETALGARGAVFKSEVTALEEKDFEDINQARFTLSWQEGGVAKDETLVTYLAGKK